MAKFTTLLLILFSLVASGQQGARLVHYQRTWNTDTIHFPCEPWELTGLSINIPDTLYDSGLISVKKMRYKGVKGLGYEVEIKEGKVYKVNITTKGRRNFDTLLLLDAEIRGEYEMVKGCRPMSLFNATKNRAVLTITVNPEVI